MHTIEEKHQFTLLRVQGWSIAKISAHMKIPKATIWRWDHDEREILPILKAARYEELQEKYVPTYEEELQQLSSYRERIRKALTCERRARPPDASRPWASQFVIRHWSFVISPKWYFSRRNTPRVKTGRFSINNFQRKKWYSTIF